MNLFQLRAFDAVARDGSFTRAAARLFISQPAVTGHIKALEEHYQITLAMPTKDLIINLAALWDVLMLHVVMLMEPGMTNIHDLDPETIDKCLSPMYRLLDAAVLDAQPPRRGSAG